MCFGREGRSVGGHEVFMVEGEAFAGGSDGRNEVDMNSSVLLHMYLT